MKNHKFILTLFAVLTSSLFFSCSKSSTNDLQDAQLCLNKASAASALGCVSGISSDTSPLAYSLRCSAVFISQGYGDAVDFADALDSINNAGNCTGGCSSTVNVLYSFNFTSAGVSTPAERLANNNAAAEAFTQCSNADAKIYTQIASMFRLGTLSAMLAYSSSGGGPIDQDDLEAELANLTPADVGAIVTVTYGNSCQNTEDASESTQAYCAELANAINSGGTEADIGSCLLNKLQNSAYVCP